MLTGTPPSMPPLHRDQRRPRSSLEKFMPLPPLPHRLHNLQQQQRRRPDTTATITKTTSSGKPHRKEVSSTQEGEPSNLIRWNGSQQGSWLLAGRGQKRLERLG